MYSEHDSGMNLKDILAIILKRKWLIIIPAVILTIVAYIGLNFLTPKYRSSSIVRIDKPFNVSRELTNIIGERRESRDEVRNMQLALQTEITSQNYLQQLIKRLNLGDDEEVIREATRLKQDASPDFTLEQIKEIYLIERLRGQISVSFIGTAQFQITAESHSPVLARDMAMNLTEIMEKEKSKYEMEKILIDQDFTDLQLQKSQYKYEQVLDSLNAAKARLAKLQLPENIISQSNRLEIISTIDKIKLDLDDYRSELNEIMSQLKTFDLEDAKLSYSDTIVELRANINVLIANYAMMMEKYSWNDQNIININIRMSDNLRLLEDALERETKNQYSAYPVNQQNLLVRKFILHDNREISNSKLQRMEQSLENIDEKINLIPELESEIAELENRVEDARRYRDAFQTEETTVGILSERAKERTKYQVIEPAQLPLEPFWPNKRNILLMGLIFGIALGGALILVVELMDNSFKRVEEVENELNIKVLGVISKIDKLKIAR